MRKSHVAISPDMSDRDPLFDYTTLRNHVLSIYVRLWSMKGANMTYTDYHDPLKLNKFYHNKHIITVVCALGESLVDERWKVGFDCGLLHVLHSCYRTVWC